MTNDPMHKDVDSMQRSREFAKVVRSCSSTCRVSARTSAQHVLVGEGLRCRSRSRLSQCELWRLGAETSQPLPVWRASWERRPTVGFSVSGRTPALDKGWSQSSRRDSKTGVPLHKKTCNRCVSDRKGSRFVRSVLFVSVLPRSFRSNSVLARSLRRLSRQQGFVDGTCCSCGSSFSFYPIASACAREAA